MGYWTNTVYVECADIDAIERTLVDLFAAEGMRRIERPAQRPHARYDAMQYAGALHCDRWALALMPGAPGWSVLKSAPLELLAEAAPHGTMRLSSLCQRLGAAAAMFNVYDSSGAVLVEVDADGMFRLSGIALGHPGGDPLSFHGHALSLERHLPRFDRLPLQGMVEQHTRASGTEPTVGNDALALALDRALGGARAGHCGNEVCVQQLIGHEPLGIGGARDLYVEWPARDRSPPPGIDRRA